MSRKRSLSHTQRRSSSTTHPNEGTIVLYLSAHGSQACEAYQNPPGANVHVLSFVPQFGEEGLMLEAPLPNVTRDSLDEVTLRVCINELQKVYHIKSKRVKHQPIATRVAECVTDVLPGMLKQLFLDAFLDHGDEMRRRFEAGFKVTAPIHDRLFRFRPHDGEDDSIYRPHYGIHILDIVTHHTRLKHFMVRNRPARGKDKEAYFEFGNITHPDHIDNVQLIIDAIRDIPDDDTREKCMVIYYVLVNQASATLSDIAFLFRSIGFAHIYLLDPSCRSIPQGAPIAMRVKARRESTDPVEHLPMSPETELPLTQSQYTMDNWPDSCPELPSHDVDNTLFSRIQQWFQWAPRLRTRSRTPSRTPAKQGGRCTKKRRWHPR